MIMRLLAKNVEAEVVDSSPVAFKQLPSLGFEVSGIGFVLLDGSATAFCQEHGFSMFIAA